MDCPARVNELVYLSLDPSEFDRAAFDGLSEGIQKIIRLSPEWAELQNPTHAPQSDADDDIPF